MSKTDDDGYKVGAPVYYLNLIPGESGVSYRRVGYIISIDIATTEESEESATIYVVSAEPDSKVGCACLKEELELCTTPVTEGNDAINPILYQDFREYRHILGPGMTPKKYGH